LESISFQNTQITKIEGNAFAGLENNLKTLSLTNAELSEFPVLNVRMPTLTTLILSDNPISKIESTAFLSLPNINTFELRKSKLPSIDLSVFAVLQPGKYYANVLLDDNAYLTSVTVSDPSKFPTPARISLTNTALETIDPKLGDLLKQNQHVTVDLDSNVHLLCLQLNWMAPYVIDDKLISTTYAKCADTDYSLLAYLLNTRDPTKAPPVPTTKAGSQVSSWISFIAMLNALVIFFK